jgi:signal transduction histidine kinase
MLRVFRRTQKSVVWGFGPARRRLTRLYLGLALLLSLGSLAGFMRLFAALGQPFGGFIWQYGDLPGFLVSYETPRHWAGPQAGLVPFTAILTIDGRPARDFGAVYATAQVGQPVTYEVRTTGGEYRALVVPITRFTFGHLVEAYGLIWLAGQLFTGAGYLLVRSASDTGRALFASHNGAVTSFAHYGMTRLFAAIMWAPCPPVLGALLCHATLVYPRPARLARRIPWLVWVGYAVGLALAGLLSLTYLFGASPPVARLQMEVLVVAVGFMAVGALATLVRGVTVFWIDTPQSRAERRQVRVLAVAWVLTMAVLVGTVAAAVLNVPTPFELLTAIALILPVGLVYAFTNADLIATLEAENALRGRLLDDLREVHHLQERILGELADELHDSALAESKGLEIQLYTLHRLVAEGRIDHDTLLDAIGRLHQQSMTVRTALRQTVEGAKPVDFVREGLPTAIGRIVAQFNAVSATTVYTLECTGPVDACMPEVRRDIYWIVRAALNNVRDHAGAHGCTIRLDRQPERLVLEICDDGNGYVANALEAPDVPQRRQLGIPAMRARAEHMGGQLEIESGRWGTLVHATIPLDN